MKKSILMIGVGALITMFSVSSASYADTLVCPDPSTGATWSCWYKSDSIEYRGKGKTTDEILKKEQTRAEKAASKLSGQKLIDAANEATMKAAIAKAKVVALNNRVSELQQKQTTDEKKGIKSRGWWYGNCYNWYDYWGNHWYRCY